jgi:hypothetical protein
MLKCPKQLPNCLKRAESVGKAGHILGQAQHGGC